MPEASQFFLGHAKNFGAIFIFILSYFLIYIIIFYLFCVNGSTDEQETKMTLTSCILLSNSFKFSIAKSISHLNTNICRHELIPQPLTSIYAMLNLKLHTPYAQYYTFAMSLELLFCPFYRKEVENSDKKIIFS